MTCKIIHGVRDFRGTRCLSLQDRPSDLYEATLSSEILSQYPVLKHPQFVFSAHMTCKSIHSVRDFRGTRCLSLQDRPSDQYEATLSSEILSQYPVLKHPQYVFSVHMTCKIINGVRDFRGTRCLSLQDRPSDLYEAILSSEILSQYPVLKHPQFVFSAHMTCKIIHGVRDFGGTRCLSLQDRPSDLYEATLSSEILSQFPFSKTPSICEECRFLECTSSGSCKNRPECEGKIILSKFLILMC
jgi:hypothetical protein